MLEIEREGQPIPLAGGSFATGGMIGATSDYGIVLEILANGVRRSSEFLLLATTTHQTKEHSYWESKRNH